MGAFAALVHYVPDSDKRAIALPKHFYQISRHAQSVQPGSDYHGFSVSEPYWQPTYDLVAMVG